MQWVAVNGTSNYTRPPHTTPLRCMSFLQVLVMDLQKTRDITSNKNRWEELTYAPTLHVQLCKIDSHPIFLSRFLFR